MTTSAMQRHTPGSGRGCLRMAAKGMRMAAKGLLSLSVLLMILIPTGLTYQSRSLRRDQNRFPPPGRLVVVNAFRLHLTCKGTGSPVIVLEAGLGDGSFIWSNLIDALAEHTQVCAYDRPGLGWSDDVSQPFNRKGVAANLHTLLKNADIPPPYLLVGHSIGGLYVRTYAQRYSDEVAGIVLIDSAHENQSGRRTDRRSSTGEILDRMLGVCAVIAPTGVFRLFGLGDALMADTGLPLSVRQAAAATLNRSTYCRTIANELNTSDIDTSLPTPPEKLGDIPLVVLVAGQDIGGPQGPTWAENPASTRGLMGSRWLRLQQELAGLSTHSRLIIAENSSHYIHLDQPALVIKSILDLLQEIRLGGS